MVIVDEVNTSFNACLNHHLKDFASFDAAVIDVLKEMGITV